MSDDDLLPEHERVRAALADVPPASAAARSAAIARALDEFDRMHTAPNVVAFPGRTRWYRGVAAAAAVLIVGVIGVGVLRNSSSSDSSSSGADAGAAVPAVPQGGAASNTKLIGNSADSITIIAASTPAPTIASIDRAAEALPQVASPEQLPDIAGALPDSGSISTARISFEFSCPLDTTQSVVREVVYQGTPAALVRDTVSGVIQAIDAKCNVLATSQP